MSNPLSIQAVPQVGGSQVAPQSSKPTQTPAAPSAKPVQLYVNPSYRFDRSVDLVVIEFHDSNGAVNNTIPSARQLQAYRTHQLTPPGEQSSTP